MGLDLISSTLAATVIIIVDVYLFFNCYYYD